MDAVIIDHHIDLVIITSRIAEVKGVEQVPTVDCFRVLRNNDERFRANTRAVSRQKRAASVKIIELLLPEKKVS
jgi:hypothetical protein